MYSSAETEIALIGGCVEGGACLLNYGVRASIVR
jgi:hypothetical protein